MPDQIRPDADSAIGNWSDQSGGTTNIFGSIDEPTTANDSDYVRSPNNPSAEVVRFRISDPASSVIQQLKVRYRAKTQSAGFSTFKVRLKQGSTLIREWVHGDLTTSFQTFERILSAAEFASISDFTDLFVEFEATSGGSYAGPGDIITWKAWYGFRGYSAAYAAPGTNPCIDLTDSAGTTTVTINILPSGLMDVATAAPLVASNYRISKFYDQSGTGAHSEQFSFPDYNNMLLLGLDGGNPYIGRHNGVGNQQVLRSVGGAGIITQPYVWMDVQAPGGENSFVFQEFGSSTGILPQIQIGTSFYRWIGGTGFVSIIPAVSGLYKAACVLANGASSSITVGSVTDGPYNPGSTSIGFRSEHTVGTVAGFPRWLEGGVAAGDQSASFAALIAQANNYWGI